MTTKHINEVVENLRNAMLRADGAGLTDGQLLDRFIERGEEAALEALVRRHGPLVWSVCRRLIGNHHDAEDAFQATFLVLVRRADTVVPREMVASWLYGVASQTARKARMTNAKRQARERPMSHVPERAEPSSECGDYLHELLHQALERLPNKFRVSVILCDLEGKTRTEAARQLGVPEGTLASWLARGRAMLVKRLARHREVVTTGVLAAALAQQTASASVVSSTIQAATVLISEQATAGVISTHVLALMEGVMKAMLAAKIKMTTTVLLAVVTMVGLGSGGLVYRMQAAEQRPSEEQQTLRANEDRAEDTEFAVQADADDEERIIGSGKEGKKEIKVSDFTALEIHLPIHVSATRGDSFSVIISGDDNLLDIVKADKEGPVLKFSAAKRSWQTKNPLKATITMPALERASVSSASRLTIKDFKANKEFKANLSGASGLDGSIDAGNLKLDASGASKVKLQGQAKQATLTASGASNLLLEEFSLETVKVTLTGASKAAVNAKMNLDYVLTGASNLQYKGNPKTKAITSGASSVSQKKS